MLPNLCSADGARPPLTLAHGLPGGEYSDHREPKPYGEIRAAIRFLAGFRCPSSGLDVSLAWLDDSAAASYLEFGNVCCKRPRPRSSSVLMDPEIAPDRLPPQLGRPDRPCRCRVLPLRRDALTAVVRWKSTTTVAALIGTFPARFVELRMPRSPNAWRRFWGRYSSGVLKIAVLPPDSLTG